jgi:hypothetical protein
MPMHPRPMTPTSGPLLPSVVVRMLHSRLVSRAVSRRAGRTSSMPRLVYWQCSSP